MKIAVLGPGGVGGLLAGALERRATRSWSSPSESTAAPIAERGLRVQSVSFGDFVAHPPRAWRAWIEPVEVLIVATKAAGLEPALERIAASRRSCCRCSTASTTSRCCASASILPPCLPGPCSRAKNRSR